MKELKEICSKIIKESSAKGRSKHPYMDIITEYKHMNFYDCFKKEQAILREYKDHRININYNGFKTTEAFNAAVAI